MLLLRLIATACVYALCPVFFLSFTNLSEELIQQRLVHVKTAEYGFQA